MKKMGIRTGGIEEAFEDTIKNYARNSNSDFKYYEIGCAGCITLKAATDIVSECISHDNWLIEGIDLMSESSVNWQEINSVFNKTNLQIYYEGVSSFNYLKDPHTRLLLWGDPRKYSKSMPNNSLDIVLIDGNHNFENVTADFLSIEDKVKQNGLVFFHDIGVEETGTDPQAGGGFIEVRPAVEKLGLFNGSRKGWRFLKEVPGSRKWGGDGNSLGIFVKQ
jgi:hypothetical protein